MKCFLFAVRPQEDWPRSKRVGYWCWQLFWVGLSGLGVGLASLFLAVGHYPLGIARGYFERPVILLLNLLLPLGLAFLFYGLTRRATRGFLLNAALVLGFSAANYYKLAFRDDPILFGDLFLLKEAGNMLGNYRLFLDGRLGLVLAAAAAGWAFLHFLVRGRPRGPLAGGAALLGLTAAVLFFHVSQDSALYNGKAAYYDRLSNPMSASQQYVAHGFVYPFFHSIADAVERPPEGYDPQVAQAMLEAYEDAEIPPDKRVNVVAIMLEAFQDFSRFGTPELSRDVYAGYHALEAESYTGDLVVNIFAGGTVDTERCFLTGYSHLPNFRGNVNAYPWYFRSQGYQTTGMHPCYQWFYNRLNINEYLGFQDYLFVENYFAPYTNGGVGVDDVFFPRLMEELAQRQQGAPIFSFSVSYQGHGPYGSGPAWYRELGDFFPEDAPYTEEEMGTMANYFGSVENTIANLTNLKNFLADQEEGYVLVVFGDHNPWMGDGNSIYEAMGLNLDQSTQEGFANYYSTRYLIWANGPAKEALGNDFVGEGPSVGPYFLMNELFELCGWEGPAYLQAVQAAAQAVSVQHTTGIYLENGRFSPTLTPEGAALARDYDWLQYYARHRFRYAHLNG